jgi:transmembrane sensor
VLPPDEQHEFDAWICSDPRHRGAFVRLNAVREDLKRLTALSAGKTEAMDLSPGSRSPTQLSRRWAIAAGIASLATGSGTWLMWRSRGERYVSGVGELREITLTDGSSMILNTATETRVRFSKSAREVQLCRGEVHFEVSKDRIRPFVVHSGDLTVTAIGTAFAVRLDGGRVDVTVTEGVVELVQTDTTVAAAGVTRRRVSANQRAIVAAASPVEVRSIEHEEAERRLAWRAGMVAFNGEPLAEAVEEVNRHNRRHIVIDDPTLAGRPVVGMFRANDVETFARAAAAAMGAQNIEEGDVIRLKAKATK